MLYYVHIILCSTANDSIVYMRLTTTNERYNKNTCLYIMNYMNNTHTAAAAAAAAKTTTK
jgi:hypothetical protein